MHAVQQMSCALVGSQWPADVHVVGQQGPSAPSPEPQATVPASSFDTLEDVVPELPHADMTNEIAIPTSVTFISAP